MRAPDLYGPQWIMYGRRKRCRIGGGDKGQGRTLRSAHEADGPFRSPLSEPTRRLGGTPRSGSPHSLRPLSLRSCLDAPSARRANHRSWAFQSRSCRSLFIALRLICSPFDPPGSGWSVSVLSTGRTFIYRAIWVFSAEPPQAIPEKRRFFGGKVPPNPGACHETADVRRRYVHAPPSPRDHARSRFLAEPGDQDLRAARAHRSGRRVSAPAAPTIRQRVRTRWCRSSGLGRWLGRGQRESGRRNRRPPSVDTI